MQVLHVQLFPLFEVKCICERFAGGVLSCYSFSKAEGFITLKGLNVYQILCASVYFWGTISRPALADLNLLIS